MEKQAEYQISSSVNDGILEIIKTGELTESTYEKMTNEVGVIIKANGVKKALWDIHALKGRREKTNFYSDSRNSKSNIYEILFAIVDLPENAHYETAAKNAGLSWKWFADMDTARKWLKSM
jgi:hypothetical protein